MKLLIFFDGGSRGNPGIAGAGAFLYTIPTSTNLSWKIKKFVGYKNTNNQAEYHGILIGLKKALELIRRETINVEEIVVQGDSKLVIKQLNGEYKVRSSNLHQLYTRCIKVITQINEFNVPIRFVHIFREANSVADQLANQAMNEKS